MKITTEMTVGIPSPPLRMMAPKGAPTKKNITQASESVIFWCHSIQCVRTYRSPSPVTRLFHSNSERKLWTDAMALRRAMTRRSGGVWATMVSNETVERTARCITSVESASK